MSAGARPDRRHAVVWPGFARAAVVIALTAGFGLGGALFAAAALGVPVQPWWPAAAQAHGHLQLVGWAGLLVIGVGLHFLPRLRGAPLARPALAPLALHLLVAGLALRALAQAALGAVGRGAPALLSPSLRGALLASGLLELAGATLALALLAATARRGPPLEARAGFRAVLPFLATAFGSYWLALALNLAGLVAAVRAGGALVPGGFDRPAVMFALHGFLVPVAVAMSTRLFPLYFRTPPPRSWPLLAGLGVALAGLVVRLAGDLGGLPSLAGLGRLGQALALALYLLGLGVFVPRRPPARADAPGMSPLSDPIHLHALTAYAWLLLAALQLGWGGVALVAPLAVAPPDVEAHLLGAGFVTLLILGVGAHLLPGFARRPVRSRALLWASLVCGNLAALLRVGPPLLGPLLPPAAAGAALALAGLVGILAVALFAHNLDLLAGPARLGGQSGTGRPQR